MLTFLEEKLEEKYYIQNIAKCGENVYFYGVNNKILYRNDIEKHTMKPYVLTPQDFNTTHMQEYSKIYGTENKIFFLPFGASVILVFDLKEEEFRSIEFPKSKRDIGAKFTDAIRIKNKLYLLPQSYDAILVVNIDSEELIDIIPVCDGESYNYYSIGFYDKKKECFVLANTQKNIVYEVGISGNNRNSYSLGKFEDGYAAVCRGSNGIWFIPYTTDKIVHKNSINGKLTILDDFPDGYAVKRNSFADVKLVNDGIYLIPRCSNMFLIVSLDNGIQKIIDDIEFDLKDYYLLQHRYCFVGEKKNILYAYSAVHEKLLTVFDNKILKTEKIVFPELNKCGYQKKRVYGLNSFLDYVVNEEIK